MFLKMIRKSVNPNSQMKKGISYNQTLLLFSLIVQTPN